MRLTSLKNSEQYNGYPSHPTTRGLTLFAQQWTDTPPDTNKGQATQPQVPSIDKILYTYAMMHLKERGSRISTNTLNNIRKHQWNNQLSDATEQHPKTKHGINDNKTQVLAKIHTFKTFEGLTLVLLKNWDLCVTMIYVEQSQTCWSTTQPSSSRSPLPLHWRTTLTGHPLPTATSITHYFPIQLFFLECLNLKVLQSFKLLPTTSSMTHCHTLNSGIFIHTSHSSINSMATGRAIHLLYRHKTAVSAILTTVPLHTAQHPVPHLQPYAHCKIYVLLPPIHPEDGVSHIHQNVGNTLCNVTNARTTTITPRSWNR